MFTKSYWVNRHEFSCVHDDENRSLF